MRQTPLIFFYCKKDLALGAFSEGCRKCLELGREGRKWKSHMLKTRSGGIGCPKRVLSW